MSIGLLRVVLCLNFVGTVVPIGARPEEVVFGEVMTRLAHQA